MRGGVQGSDLVRGRGSPKWTSFNKSKQRSHGDRPTRNPVDRQIITHTWLKTLPYRTPLWAVKIHIICITNPYTGLYWISFEYFVHWKTNNMRFGPPALQCCCGGWSEAPFSWGKIFFLMGNPYPANYFYRMNLGTERASSAVTITQPKLNAEQGKQHYYVLHEVRVSKWEWFCILFAMSYHV